MASPKPVPKDDENPRPPSPHPSVDEISLTSTQAEEGEPEESYEVVKLLAERRDGHPGDPHYLVQWAGYAPEHWSWEPEANIQQVCLDEWAVNREKEESGKQESFDVEEWEKLREAFLQGKWERHQRRNRLRRQRGLPPNLYEEEGQSDYYPSDEDAGNDDDDDDSAEISPCQDEHKLVDPVLDSDETQNPPLSGKPDGKSGLKERAKHSLKHQIAAQSTLQDVGRHSEAPTRSERSTAPGYKEGDLVHPQTETGGKAPSRDHLQSASSVMEVRSEANKDGRVDSRPLPRARKQANVSKPPGAKTRLMSTAGNVFLTGKQARSRPSLSQNMSDVSREARMFSSHRITRKAELRGREKADKAPPDPAHVRLFNISNGGQTQATTGPSEPDQPPPLVPSSDQFKEAARETSKSAMKIRSIDEASDLEGTQSAPVRIRSKSVRFDNNEDVLHSPDRNTASFAGDQPIVAEPEAMDLCEDELFVSQHPTPPRGTALDQSVQGEAASQQRRSILASSQDETKRTVDRRVQFGLAGTGVSLVKFHGTPREPANWPSEFSSAATLVFTCVCSARSFASRFQDRIQHSTLEEAILAHGDVTSEAEAGALRDTAEKLSLGSFGLMCFGTDSCIIIYPAECQEWEKCVPETESGSSPDVPLKHVTFNNGLAALKPVTLPGDVRDALSDVKGSLRSTVMNAILGFTYEQLLPTQLRDDPRSHNFFLAFPPSKGSLYNSVCGWLRDANPQCRIFTVQAAGDWQAFIGLKECGTVIIHESATSVLRILPRILRLLHGSNTASSFWCLGESMSQPSFQASYMSLLGGVDIGFTRLFPQGSAILLTPSFLLTQPSRARQLLQWYRQQLGRTSMYSTLVVSAGIVRYLEELALEKAEEREMMLRSRSPATQSDLEHEARLIGISHDDCEARFEIHAQVVELIKSGKGILSYEVQEPFVFADECIDANDEHSLSNWFGWWSHSHLDQYRKFHVLGSQENDSKRASRILTLPSYTRGSTADPETALAKLPATREETAVDNLATSSQLLSRVDASSLSDFLQRPDFHRHGFLKLYGYPVSYFDNAMKMADSFGDFRMEFASINAWFEFLLPFASGKGASHSAINTYLGLFFTIDGEWDPQADAVSQPLRRYSWIAAYRVQSPFRTYWANTELLIWDPAASTRFTGNKHPRKSKLIPAQRALVDLVQRVGKVKNPRLPLSKVWYGGFNAPSSEHTSGVDCTLEMLENMINNPKNYLPAPYQVLPREGFEELDLDEPESTNGDETVERMDLDESESGHVDEVEDNLKIVFHPPRGNGSNTGRPSICGNTLFQEASRTRSLNPKAKGMEYKYLPTFQWYMGQKAEGRHFEFVNVDTWKPIFKLLGVPIKGEYESLS